MTEQNAEPKIGHEMQDGTIFAGVSPDTGKPMFTTPADATLTMTFNHAKKYASRLDAHSHKDWRLPTQAELNVLFNNRAAIGGFNLSGSFADGWYWSSTRGTELGLIFGGKQSQRFSDGAKGNRAKDTSVSLRCVRSLPKT